MPDFPAMPAEGMPPAVFSTADFRTCPAADVCAVMRPGTFGTAAWPSANLAIAVPFHTARQVTIYQMAILTGATVSGNVDVGIYDINLSRLVSAGTTAEGVASSVQALNVTDTVLSPGDYYLAMAVDNVTALHTRAAQAAGTLAMVGCIQMASAFPLPATLTSTALTSAYLPFIAAVASGSLI